MTNKGICAWILMCFYFDCFASLIPAKKYGS
jgi:hypothetical protein